MSELSRSQVAHIAHLSRLSLTEAELDVYSVQLQAVMQYMDKLHGIDATGVTPMYNPSPATNHVRSDIPDPSLSQHDALAMAPAQEEGRFSVPQILGEE